MTDCAICNELFTPHIKNFDMYLRGFFGPMDSQKHFHSICDTCYEETIRTTYFTPVRIFNSKALMNVAKFYEKSVDEYFYFVPMTKENILRANKKLLDIGRGSELIKECITNKNAMIILERLYIESEIDEGFSPNKLLVGHII